MYHSPRVLSIGARTFSPALALRGYCPAATQSSSAAADPPFAARQSSFNLPRHSLRCFSYTRSAMAGTKIDGTAIAKGIREKLNARIKETQQKNSRYNPTLVIIQGQFCYI